MNKRLFVAALLVAGSALVVAQQARDLNLRGDRFAPLTWDRLTSEQKTMVNDLLSGSRTSLNGPFNVQLRSPEMGNLSQKLGDYLRFCTSVPRRLNEMAILMTAKAWVSQYEWTAHKTLALDAGLSTAVIDDIQAGQRPARMQPDEAVVYDFCTALRERKRVSDPTFRAAVALLGERGVADLVALMGYYDLVSMTLNVDRYPLPAGTAQPFPEPGASSTSYRPVASWAQLPAGRVLGNTSAVEIDPDGRSVWIADRCASTTCEGSALSPIMKFDASGKLVRTFGAGMFVMPHGFHIDGQGNVWITDAQGAAGKGHQVFKFSPDGRVLLTLGRAGVAGDGPDTFNRPTDVITAPNGDIFVSDGHGGDSNARIVKFSSDGKFLKAWGRKGSAHGEFDLPHAFVLDRQGRLWVSDRDNRRLQIFSQDGSFIDDITSFGPFSGMSLDPSGTLFGVDSTSLASHGRGFSKGIRIIDTLTRQIVATIPDPVADPTNASGPEGIATDAEGNLFVTYTDGRGLVKFEKH